MIVGAVTGSLIAPHTLLLGRYDDGGRFQYVGRITALARAAGAAVASLLAPARKTSHLQAPSSAGRRPAVTPPASHPSYAAGSYVTL